jgi:hypothetical protein
LLYWSIIVSDITTAYSNGVSSTLSHERSDFLENAEGDLSPFSNPTISPCDIDISPELDIVRLSEKIILS